MRRSFFGLINPEFNLFQIMKLKIGDLVGGRIAFPLPQTHTINAFFTMEDKSWLISVSFKYCDSAWFNKCSGVNFDLPHTG